jgi:uncharacterized protein YfaS (alpha-2-macroglobulin family)
MNKQMHTVSILLRLALWFVVVLTIGCTMPFGSSVSERQDNTAVSKQMNEQAESQPKLGDGSFARSSEPTSGEAKVELFSPQGVVKNVRQVSVRFSESMVAFGDPRPPSPFQIDCQPNGEGRWVDSQNWVYDFDTDLESGIRCLFKLQSKLRTLTGKPLSGTQVFLFNTGGPNIRKSLPGEEYRRSNIKENQVFILALDGPVLENSILPNARCKVVESGEQTGVELITGKQREEILAQQRDSNSYSELLQYEEESEMPLKGEALRKFEERLVVLRCQRSLPPDSQINLIWASGISSPGGIKTTEEQRLSFVTRPEFTTRFECVHFGKCLPNRPINVIFSAPVATSFAKGVHITGEDGQEYKADLSEEESEEEYIESLIFKGPFSAKSRLHLNVPPNLIDQDQRPLHNASSFPMEIAIDEYPPMAKFPDEFTIIPWQKGASLPVTLSNLESKVNVKTLHVTDSEQITTSTALSRFPRADFAVIYWLSRIAKERDWERSHHELITNVAIMNKQLLSGNSNARSFTLKGRSSKGTVPEVTDIPFQEPGFYVVELVSSRLAEALGFGSKPVSVAATALVTNMAVHVKQNKNGVLLVWVTSLDRGRPIKDAKVTIRAYCGDHEDLEKLLWATDKLLWEGKTEDDGVASLGDGVALGEARGYTHIARIYTDNAGNYCYPVISAQSGRDMSFALTWGDDGIDPDSFKLNTAISGTIAHTVFDRTLFRAGETVSMKHFLREQTLNGLERFSGEIANQMEMNIRHESGQRFTIPLQIDNRGHGESQWTIPASARLGNYEVELGGEVEKYGFGSYVLGGFTSGSFRVEEFRLPTMKATLQPSVQPLIQPVSVPIDVSVSYLNGGAASGLPVKLRSQVKPRSVSFPGYDDYIFGDDEFMDEEYSQSPDSEALVQEQTLTLDDAGKAHADVSDLSQTDKSSQLIAEVEYPDANGEFLTVTHSVDLWPSGINLGLRHDYWATQNKPLHLSVVSLDVHGKPVADQAVTVELLKRIYSGNQSRTRWLQEACSGRTDHQGLMFCEVVSKESGTIIIQARTKDSFGNISQTNSDVYVSDENGRLSADSDNQRMTIVPERKEYEPGEVANIQIPMSFLSATALVTVEREGILDAYVTELSANKPVVNVQVKPNYAPNVYVSVFVVNGLKDVKTKESGETQGLSSYQLGITPLKVSWTPRRLMIRVTTDQDESYHPRQTVKVRVSVGRADKGVLPEDAEIAMAAVDEALLELQPNDSWNLLEKMMTERGFQVRTLTSFVGSKVPFFNPRAIEAVFLKKQYNGGPDEPKQQFQARELFNSLLLWKGRVQLDEKGEAEIEVPLNDSLTAFRLVAIASAGEGWFGTGSTTIRTSQDIMLQSGLPSVVREGDQFLATFTVRNGGAKVQNLIASAEVRLENGQTLPAQLQPQQLERKPGESNKLNWPVQIPIGAGQMVWEITVKNETGEIMDRLRAQVEALPVHQVRVWQATLTQLHETLDLQTQKPADALPDRGDLRISLQAKLGDSLPGVISYMSSYPYTCLEQRISRAIALSDPVLWQSVMNTLPDYLDSDGLLKYFPDDKSDGSDVLTSYVLAISHEAGLEIPNDIEIELWEGLKGFVEGRIIRSSPLRTTDLNIRKLTAIEALSRYGEADSEMLKLIVIDPNLWPTSAVLDWLNILQRITDMPQREAGLEEAQQIIRSRINMQGTVMTFSREEQDYLWWLMLSPDTNAVRALLTLMPLPAWHQDIPRLAQGILERQKKGHWNTTTANAWGVVAMEKFSSQYEKIPVTGQSTAEFGEKNYEVQWQEKIQPSTFELPWPEKGKGKLKLRHMGTGAPWAIIQSRAAVPLKKPLFTGFRIQRKVTPVSQQRQDVWTQGDVARVTLTIEAQSVMTWVVVDDPIPSGASILGSGLGRDSTLLVKQKQNFWDRAWLAYEERKFERFRAYYEFVPKGKWTVEYTMRYNTPGHYELPQTQVEAMYAPEMFGQLPNDTVEIME